MKKLILLLLVGSWSFTFADTLQRKVIVYGQFPIEKLSLLSTIQHDTLIFDRTEAGSAEKWGWGFFFPHQYKASYLVDYYYQVECKKNLISVSGSVSSGKPRNMGSYLLNPIISPWVLIAVPSLLHLIFFLGLRARLFYIYRDNRAVTLLQQRKEKIRIVLGGILLAMVLGCFGKAYFFIFFPLVYIIFLFQTSKTYSRLGKVDGDLFIGNKWLGV